MSNDNSRGKPHPLDDMSGADHALIRRAGGERDEGEMQPRPPTDRARATARQGGKEHPAATADGRTRDTADDEAIYDDPPWPEDADTTRNEESYPARGAHNAPPVTAGEASRGGTNGVTHHPFRVRR